MALTYMGPSHNTVWCGDRFVRNVVNDQLLVNLAITDTVNTHIICLLASVYLFLL